MSSRIRWSVVLTALAVVVAIGIPAQAGHTDDPRTDNLEPKGHIVEPASLLNPAVGNPDIHTDIAFWGKNAFQGTWLGFNIRDISDPDNPTQVSHTVCQGNQGDVVVWDDILVRSWNSPAPADNPETPEDERVTCDGQIVEPGFEGLHVFNISDLTDPVLVGSVDLSSSAIEGRCGSHTATGVPDLAKNRLLIYNSGSQCDGIDIVGIPLGNPAAAASMRHEEAGRDCHDTGVILGDAMMAACAGDDGFTVWELDPADLTDPQQVLSKNVNDEAEIDGVSIGHSAAFTWDGEVLIFGHEPGGGVAPRCQETGTVLQTDEEGNPTLIQTDDDKSAFFFDADTGDFLGKFTLPRPQSSTENCTIHNYNVVPTRSGNYVLVHGSYQSGTSVVDFTDPANAVEVAWSDPPPIVPPDLGGAWSSYWYNNFIYETNITEGLNIFRFSGRETAGAMRVGHLNPQTQEFTIG